MIEKLLKQAIDTYQKELNQIKVNIQELEKSKLPVVLDLETARNELRKICVHEKSSRIEGAYFPAGFDYYSETNYTIVCDNCGKVLESKCIRGSHFG